MKILIQIRDNYVTDLFIGHICCSNFKHTKKARLLPLEEVNVVFHSKVWGGRCEFSLYTRNKILFLTLDPGIFLNLDPGTGMEKIRIWDPG
jgi:hypothetical protein